jgi:hypothetical protein
MTPELALRVTIWLSVLAWASSEVLRRAGADRRDAARVLYTAGALLLIAHTAAAFQWRHDWSHAAAFDATAARSATVTGFASGVGIYLNYLMAALWIADAAWWWLRPRGYLMRPRAVDLSMFAFLVFMIVNGAVVFAAGPMRVTGAAAVAAALVARMALPAPRPVRGRV